MKRLRLLLLRLKSRAVLAAALFIIFAIPGYFGTSRPAALWGFFRGPHMKHEVTSPFKTDKRTYSPGDTVYYHFTRKTDFDGIQHVVYNLVREVDEDGDGVPDTIYSVDGGSMDRLMKKGITKVESRVTLPIGVADGTYRLIFATTLRYELYERIQESYSERFDIRTIGPPK